ncbi:MAG: DegT/DnrJ/EryC1/StrS family aminotransferase [bacterium]
MDPIPFLDLTPQNEPLQDELKEAAARVIESGVFILGPEVEAFEEAWADYCGTEHAVALNSGTSALHLGLLALDAGPGDEVITVAHTFIATVEAILYTGARPVYADIHPETLVMDVRTVEGLITERTRAILPVHLYGNPVDMTALLEVADRHGVPLLEDAAQAHGAAHRGRKAGSWGRAGTFSFYPTKNLGALGEGGILTTDDEEVAESVRSLRNHGQTGAYYHTAVGYNYRMTAFQGAMLRTKLTRLETWNGQRRELAARYDELCDEAGIERMQVREGDECVYHLYPVLVPDRDRVQQELEEKGIPTRVHYPTPLFSQPAAASAAAVGRDDLAVTRSAAARVLSLPFYPGMGTEKAEEVVTTLSALVD